MITDYANSVPDPPGLGIKMLPAAGVGIWSLLCVAYAHGTTGWKPGILPVVVLVMSLVAGYVCVDEKGPGRFLAVVVTAGGLAGIMLLALIVEWDWSLLLATLAGMVLATIAWVPALMDLDERRMERATTLRVEELRTLRAAGQPLPVEDTGYPITTALAAALPATVGATVSLYQPMPDGSWAALVALPPGTVTPGKLMTPQVHAMVEANLQVPSGWQLEVAEGRTAHEVAYAFRPRPVLEAPTRHPALDVAEQDLWAPLPLGVDQQQDPGKVLLEPWRTKTPSILLAGQMGAGKSTMLHGWVGHLGRNGHPLFLVDPKRAEFTRYKGTAVGVAFEIEEAIQLLEEYFRRMKNVYTVLAEAGHDNVLDFHEDNPAGQMPVLGALVIDEFEEFTNYGDDGPRKRFNELLKNIASQCRAAGGLIIMATQNPDGRLWPTFIRHKMSLRIALRCSEGPMVETILGRGMVDSCPAHRIDPSEVGTGFVVGSHITTPTKLRGWPLSRHERDSLVESIKQIQPDEVAVDLRPEEVARRMRGEGASLREIEARTGISRSTLWRKEKEA